MVKSPYQQAVYDEFVNTNHNLVIEAVAGSGKTTMLEMLVDAIPAWASKNNLSYTQLKVVSLAFNVKIKDAMIARLPAWVSVRTLNAFGYAAITKKFGRIKEVVDTSKRVRVITENDSELSAFVPDKKKKEDDPALVRLYTLADLVSKVKNTLTDENDDQAVLALCDHFGIDLADDVDLYMFGLQKVLKACRTNITDMIDFDDQIYLPHALNLPIDPVDILFVDEGQDMNIGLIKMIKRACPTGRIVVVGDRYQSIYGFRGADAQAMPKTIDLLNAKAMPLSICYRCDRAMIELAKMYVPSIEARPNADEGSVNYMSVDDFQKYVKAGDGIICRTNAPLIEACYGLLLNGVKAYVYGRDVAKTLKATAKKCVVKGDWDKTQEKLSQYFKKEKTRLLARDASQSAIENLEDRVEVIRLVFVHCTNPEDVYVQLDLLFSDQTDAVVLSSVHKAKGLEWDKVWILKPELLPMQRKNQKEWEIQQENNIAYVAYTRAKHELVFVTSDD
jgi:superfamily I DNA/RNA helicase